MLQTDSIQPSRRSPFSAHGSPCFWQCLCWRAKRRSETATHHALLFEEWQSNLMLSKRDTFVKVWQFGISPGCFSCWLPQRCARQMWASTCSLCIPEALLHSLSFKIDRIAFQALRVVEMLVQSQSRRTQLDSLMRQFGLLCCGLPCGFWQIEKIWAPQQAAHRRRCDVKMGSPQSSTWMCRFFGRGCLGCSIISCPVQSFYLFQRFQGELEARIQDQQVKDFLNI